uniref:Uncharacterized protein n=1 Tax=Ficedula albicollis TaxID=59894 RepID=A0A803W3T1_FICAL
MKTHTAETCTVPRSTPGANLMFINSFLFARKLSPWEKSWPDLRKCHTFGFATGAFADHYAFHLLKTLEQVITETVKMILTSRPSLILSVSPCTGKTRIKTSHRKMILNHLYKRRSSYLFKVCMQSAV